jgi:hypothetical protein
MVPPFLTSSLGEQSPSYPNHFTFKERAPSVLVVLRTGLDDVEQRKDLYSLLRLEFQLSSL